MLFRQPPGERQRGEGRRVQELDVPQLGVLQEVRDDNGLPVEGAEVKFDLPPAGPGGSFPGQQFTATAKTNIQGQAAVSFVPNFEAGRFNIRVTATLGNRIGHVVITQTNSARTSSAEPRSGPFRFAWWKVAVVAGAGATLGIILAKRGG